MEMLVGIRRSLGDKQSGSGRRRGTDRSPTDIDGDDVDCLRRATVVTRQVSQPQTTTADVDASRADAADVAGDVELFVKKPSSKASAPTTTCSLFFNGGMSWSSLGVDGSGRGHRFTTLLTFVAVVMSALSPRIGVDATEYCLIETFNVSCSADEIILMTSAVYGRMQNGRCMRSDFGHVGCQADVTQYMDDQCSGRRRCEVPVTKLLTVATPCPADMVSYLEASHTCVPVSASSDKCSPDGYSPLIDHQDGHIPLTRGTASGGSGDDVDNFGVPSPRPSIQQRHRPLSGSSSDVSGSLSGVGPSRRCPWQISVDENQRVEFTLLAFGLQQQTMHRYRGSAAAAATPYEDRLPSHRLPPQQQQHQHQSGAAVHGLASQQTVSSSPCPWSLVFEEEPLTAARTGSASSGGVNADHDVQSTGGEVERPLCRISGRQTSLFTSATNRVTVYLVHKTGAPLPGNFILKYEAIGCRQLKVPDNVWVRQDRSTARVKCNATEETWYLACNGRHWTGELGNCTASSSGGAETGANVHEYGANSSSSSNLPYGFLMAVVIGVLLGVLIGAIPLGLVYVCLKRKWKRQTPPYAADGLYGYGVVPAGSGSGGLLHGSPNGGAGPSSGISVYYPELQHVLQHQRRGSSDCAALDDDQPTGGPVGSFYPGLLKPYAIGGSGKSPPESPSIVDMNSVDSGLPRTAVHCCHGSTFKSPTAEDGGGVLVTTSTGTLCNCRSGRQFRPHPNQPDFITSSSGIVDVSCGGTLMRGVSAGGLRPEHVYESASVARVPLNSSRLPPSILHQQHQGVARSAAGRDCYPKNLPTPPPLVGSQKQLWQSKQPGAGGIVYYEVDPTIVETTDNGSKQCGGSTNQQMIDAKASSGVGNGRKK